MTKVDLLSLVLTLRPMPAPESGGDEVKWLGRASHALLLDAVRWSNPTLAERLHSGDGLRPVTASNLIGYSRKRGLNPGQTYTLRLTALTEPAATALMQAMALTPDLSPASGSGELGPLGVGANVRLDTTLFRIEAVTCDAARHPWAAATTYESLSAPWLLGRATPERRLALEFNSPTTFKKSDRTLSAEGEQRPARHIAVPLPELVFGSLLNRWNAFAPVALPDEARRYAEECLALAAYQLHTRAAPMKAEGLRVGAVGRARYAALTYDRYWLSLINLLADFAFFAGVGAGTTVGLGQCRRIGDRGSIQNRQFDIHNPKGFYG